ncbi:MAG: hypothetical protein IJB65_02415 [Clostridia bacterium]|nr:hypothetical protein [Clostridia bacterium]
MKTVYCPLKDARINGDDCLIVCDVVDGLIKPTLIPDEIKWSEQCREICKKCRYHEDIPALQIKIKREEFDILQTLIPELYPNVPFSLITEDNCLVALGLCDSAPCIVEFNLTEDEFDQLLEDLNEIEVAAFNTPSGTHPNKDNTAYQKYLKYGCLYDILYNAEKR